MARNHQTVAASALYDCGLWTLSAALQRRIDAFEFRLLRQVAEACRDPAEIPSQLSAQYVSVQLRHVVIVVGRLFALGPGVVWTPGPAPRLSCRPRPQPAGSLVAVVRPALERGHFACGSMALSGAQLEEVAGCAARRLFRSGLAPVGFGPPRMASCLLEMAIMVRRAARAGRVATCPGPSEAVERR